VFGHPSCQEEVNFNPPLEPPPSVFCFPCLITTPPPYLLLFFYCLHLFLYLSLIISRKTPFFQPEMNLLVLPSARSVVNFLVQIPSFFPWNPFHITELAFTLLLPRIPFPPPHFPQGLAPPFVVQLHAPRLSMRLLFPLLISIHERKTQTEPTGLRHYIHYFSFSLFIILSSFPQIDLTEFLYSLGFIRFLN